MARPEKVAVVDDVRDRFEQAAAAVLTEYRGLTVAELADLRAELRKAGAEYKVAKNTLVRIAVRDAGLEIPDELLTGPTAVTFCSEDPVGPTKVLRTFAKDHPALVVKGGILEGRLLDAGETLKLADLESREELLSKLAGMMQTIIAQPARLAQANLSKIARLFAALQVKREEAGETAAPPADAAPAAAAEPSPEAEDQASAQPAEGESGSEPAVDETPEPDSPAEQTT